MEPRSAERGNVALSYRESVTASRLQWSHAQPNVETGTVTKVAIVVISASMEPRSAERGNSLPVTWSGTGSAALQWSHAQPNVET